MKPKTNPKTGVTFPVMESKDRKVFADAKDRLLLYQNWQDDAVRRNVATEIINGITTLLKAHANGEEGGGDDGDSNQAET